MITLQLYLNDWVYCFLSVFNPQFYVSN